MEGDHVDAVVEDNKKLDSIFTLFSDLTGEKNENPKYCLKLIRNLRGGGFRVGRGNNLEYSLKRLVRGLGSTRLRSQCGCFAALTSILKYRTCLVENVLQALENEQKPVQGVTKSEAKAFNAQCILTCGAIIHSGQFSGQSVEIQENILRQLIAVGTKKSYLFPVACQFLVDVICVIDQQQFKNIVWPICKTGLLENLNECGPDSFFVFLVCLKKNNVLVNKFLHKSSFSPDLLVENIVRCIFNSSVKCNHPVLDHLGQYFCTYVTSPIRFWSKCVNEYAKVNANKDAILITIFYYIIKNLQEPKIIPKLLVPKFLETLLKVLSLKKGKVPNDGCSNTARLALNSMVTLLSTPSTSDEIKFHTLKKLLFYPGNLKFELKTGTKCMHTLASQLSCDFTKKLLDIYRQVVSGEVKKKVDENGTEDIWSSKEKQYALHVFTKTLNHPSLKKEVSWKLEQIKFMFEVGFLKKFQLQSEVEKCAKDCFFKAIAVQMPSLKDLITFLDELLFFINESIQNKQFKAVSEVESFWNKMYSSVKTLKKKWKSQIFTAVHILLMYMGLYLLTDYELAKNGIEELLSCYQQIKDTQKKTSHGTDTPHWTEVTVDLILSLLSRENNLWRHVVSCIFPQLVSQITPTALHQIIQTLDPKAHNEILRHPDSDDSEDSEDSESTLSEPEDSDPEADDEGNPSDQLRLAVRNALGYSAAHIDDESIDMDQMDEEEEKRLNESLSEAFRLFRTKSQAKKKKKKQTKEDEVLTHFRLRVLDLVDIYLSNCPSMGGCLDLLPALLNLLELSIRDHHQRPLHTRLDSIIKHLVSLKSYSDLSTVDQVILRQAFHSVISRKETSALVFVEMSPRISDCTTYLVRCSQLLPNGNGDVPLVEEYEALLKAFLQSREFRLPISVFQAVLRMCWKGNFKIVATLFQFLVSPNLRIFKKMKIIELLRIFYKNDRLHGSCDKDSELLLDEAELNFVKEFTSALSEYEGGGAKSNEKMHLSFLSNVIALICVIQTCRRKHRCQTQTTPPWTDLVEKMAKATLINGNKKTRSQLANLANMLKVQLPATDKTNGRKTTREASDRAQEQPEDVEPAKRQEKKRKKKMSAETRKLKKESRKLREEISSADLVMIRFSQVDSSCFPQTEMQENGGSEDEQGEELAPPKKKKRKHERAVNGSA